MPGIRTSEGIRRRAAPLSAWHVLHGQFPGPPSQDPQRCQCRSRCPQSRDPFRRSRQTVPGVRSPDRDARRNASWHPPRPARTPCPTDSCPHGRGTASIPVRHGDLQVRTARSARAQPSRTKPPAPCRCRTSDAPCSCPSGHAGRCCRAACAAMRMTLARRSSSLGAVVGRMPDQGSGRQAAVEKLCATLRAPEPTPWLPEPVAPLWIRVLRVSL